MDLASPRAFSGCRNEQGDPKLAKEALGERASGKPVEVWFQDEARVGQQGTLTRIWARRA
jgi:hypothetical protein